MEEVFKKYDYIISLGYNCFPKLYMLKNEISQETNFFDYTGTSMWGINDLIKNNFSDSLNKNKLQEIETESHNNKKYITHLDYYIRFPHDLANHKELYNKKIFHKFFRKYRRRIIRFNEVLSKHKKVLFIRTKEEMNNRIILENHKEKYSLNELDYVIEFSNIIRNKYPKLNFTILYITEDKQNTFLESHNIIIIQQTIPNIIFNYETSFTKIFEDNMTFIINHI